MGKIVVLTAVWSILGIATTAAQSQTRATVEVCTLKVEGMACSACAARVEKAALEIEGVTAAKVSQPKGTAAITFEPSKTSPEAIAKRITTRTGFKAEVTAIR